MGSLSLWMYNLKTANIISHYQSNDYSGPAMKLGAGLGAGEALQVASQAGYRLVTGECATVGLTGGYAQGGGHSPLNSAHGLGADNVLEWELVTGDGEHLTATPEQNSDLYWALSGGGGGTYGVVLSMTYKIYPEGPVQGPLLTFGSPTIGNEIYWKGVGVFFKFLNTIVKGTNNSIQFNVWNDSFEALFVLLDQPASAVNRTWGPLLAELRSLGIQYNTTMREMKSFTDYYTETYGPLPYGLPDPASTTLNSRLIPQAVVADSSANSKLMDAMALTTKSGEFIFGCTASDVGRGTHPDNAVLPAWRDSIAMCIMNGFWNWTAPFSENVALKETMVNVYAPAIDAATPGSGVYLNEIDPLYKGDFKSQMYGSNYDRLLDIKHKHDPDYLFYGHFAVGSDEFTVDGSGRLCH